MLQGTIDYADAGPTPFIGQVARVLPGSATAEIALIKRPAAKAKRLPYYQLQNLAAEACGLVFLPLDGLKLHSSTPADPWHPISEPPLRETSPAKFAHGQIRSSQAQARCSSGCYDKIVARIEQGAGNIQMPWHRPGLSFAIPKNALTGQPYRGTNILALWIDASEKVFERQIWATYKQWNELGAQVRKGEKGSLINSFNPANRFPRTRAGGAEDEGEDEESAKRLYAKAAYVFNAAQVDGFALEPEPPRPDLTTRLAHADAFIEATGAEFREGGFHALYRHRELDGSGDFIQMPPRSLFTGTATSTPTEAYEAVRLHELTHWSGAPHRLNREHGKRFGDKAYSFEELCAELGSAYLCAELQITNTPRDDHAQYVASWLEVMKGEKKAIFTAASLASRRHCALFFSLQPRAPESAQHAPPRLKPRRRAGNSPAASHNSIGKPRGSETD